MFVCLEVQSNAIRMQSEETLCDSISRMKCRVSHVRVLFSDDGKKKDMNDFSHVVCWASNLSNDWASREGFV